MAYRTGLVVGLSMTIVSLVVATACSSSSSSTPAGTKTVDGGVVVATDVCKKTGDYDSCVACCNPPVGYLTASQTFDTCMCQGVCAAPCADSVCVADGGVPADQSDACQNCLDNDPSPSSKACAAQAKTVCDNDTSCARYTQCVNDACSALDGGH